MIKVTAVIPFYQNDSGILRKAIESALSQSDAISVEIIVVDDESPASPDEDVRVAVPDHCSLRVLKQRNAGPGAARNLGLDNIAQDSDFIAFLDSDDVWDSQHLANAINALGSNMDFYFANHIEPDAKIDTFTVRGGPRAADHELLPNSTNCYRYTGDMVDQIIVENIIETSTVVFRRATLGDLRFRYEFRNAFEDHLFWLSAAEKTKNIVFSTHVDCRYGKGVNIYRSIGLGSARLLSQLIDQTRFRNELRAKYCKTKRQKLRISQLANETRAVFIAEILYRVKRRLSLEWQLVIRMFRLDPSILVVAIPIALGILLRRKKALG